jgi:hypothetical protein
MVAVDVDHGIEKKLQPVLASHRSVQRLLHGDEVASRGSVIHGALLLVESQSSGTLEHSLVPHIERTLGQVTLIHPYRTRRGVRCP